MNFKFLNLLFTLFLTVGGNHNHSQPLMQTALHSMIRTVKKTTNNALETILSSLDDEKDLVRKAINTILEALTVEDGEGFATAKPDNCAELYTQGHTTSGVYTIYPKSWYKIRSMKVYCDMETDGGGWTVFQRRGQYDIVVNFTRNWNDYEKGFGDLSKEFWLGNSFLFVLTNQDLVSLRVDVEDYDGNKGFANYKKFHVASSKEKFLLSIDGYSGNIGDSMDYHKNKSFVTVDKDNNNQCAQKYKGGWWYDNCHHSNLNGIHQNAKNYEGITWHYWYKDDTSFKRSNMKIRPLHYLSEF